MHVLPASRVGLFCWKRWRTCSQLSGPAVCASVLEGSNARSARYFQNWFFMMVQTPEKGKARWPLFLSAAKAMAHPPPVAKAATIGKNTETRAPGFIDLLHEQFSSRKTAGSGEKGGRGSSAELVTVDRTRERDLQRLQKPSHGWQSNGKRKAEMTEETQKREGHPGISRRPW